MLNLGGELRYCSVVFLFCCYICLRTFRMNVLVVNHESFSLKCMGEYLQLLVFVLDGSKAFEECRT